MLERPKTVCPVGFFHLGSPQLFYPPWVRLIHERDRKADAGEQKKKQNNLGRRKRRKKRKFVIERGCENSFAVR